jgi:Tfp pilus assembly protein PilO
MDQPILPITNQYKKYAKSITPFFENQKTKNYSTVIFFFLVLSVFGWYAIRPTIQTILYLRREIKDKTEVDKKMDQKIYALIEANSAYENNQKLFPLLDEAIPSTPDALDIVSQINTLAKTNNLILSSLQITNIPLSTQAASLSISPSKTQQRQTTFPITFSVEGNYIPIVTFLKQLVTMRRIITIQSMNFIPIKPSQISATVSAGPASIKVTINLMGYYETK